MSLDAQDLAASLTRMYPSFADDGGYMWPDLVYILDVVGVKAKTTKDRFVARSYGLRGLDDIPSQLQLGRPILAGIKAFDSWNREPTLTTGFVDGEKPGEFLVSFTGAIVGWDPLTQQFRVLVPWPKWGHKGMATLTAKAATASFDTTSLRSLEPVPKPVPSNSFPSDEAEPRKRRGR